MHFQIMEAFGAQNPYRGNPTEPAIHNIIFQDRSQPGQEKALDFHHLQAQLWCQKATSRLFYSLEMDHL